MKKNFLPEEFELVKVFFSDLEVSWTSRGNIKINRPGNDETWYVIGLNSEGFWVRRMSYSTYWGNYQYLNTTRLHLNQNTGKYTFEDFDDVFNYFGNLVYSNKLKL